VLSADDGRHALELAARNGGPIDLLITDVVMPGLGGQELARELRQVHPGLRVLYLSGYTDDVASLSQTLDERTRFLAKPFLPAQLTQLVASLLERKRATA
jgi:two-component system cell cycle sensor histidine kinase/response regulator CckA